MEWLEQLATTFGVDPLGPDEEHDLLRPEVRPAVLFHDDAYRWDPAADDVAPRAGRRLVKWIPRSGVAPLEDGPGRYRTAYGRLRRGPYLASDRLPPRLEVGVRDGRLTFQGVMSTAPLVA